MENSIAMLIAGIVGLVVFVRLLRQTQERQRAINDKVFAAQAEALEGQRKELAMQERSLAIQEETLTLHRETNDLLRRFLEKQ